MKDEEYKIPCIFTFGIVVGLLISIMITLLIQKMKKVARFLMLPLVAVAAFLIWVSEEDESFFQLLENWILTGNFLK